MRMAPKVLVFANRIKTVRFLQQTITDAGFKALQLHGDRSQAEREVHSEACSNALLCLGASACCSQDLSPSPCSWMLLPFDLLT